MFRVKNVGDAPFLGRYRQQWIEIPSGAEMILETGAVHAWLGNPAAKNTSTWKQREDEDRRVRFMWCGEQVDTPNSWPRMKPTLEVYNLDGQRYWTVADDPDGTLHASTEATADMEKESLVAALREMQERLAVLESNKSELKLEKAPKLPTDNPRSVKVAD